MILIFLGVELKKVCFRFENKNLIYEKIKLWNGKKNDILWPFIFLTLSPPPVSIDKFLLISKFKWFSIFSLRVDWEKREKALIDGGVVNMTNGRIFLREMVQAAILDISS